MKEKDNYTPIRAVPKNLPAESEYVGQIEIPAMDEEVQLREYWKIVLKYRTIIVASVAACFFLSILYAFLATPLYTAASKIRISTYEPVLSATKIEGVLQEKSKEANYLETQIQEIKSFSLADRVLGDDEVRNGLFGDDSKGMLSGIFSGSKEEVPESIDTISGYKRSISEIKGYLERIGVNPIRRTSLVSIHATAEKPRLAALMANKHAIEYIEWVRSSRVKQQSRALTFLKGQAADLREKVAEFERDLADYAEENSIVAVNSDENITAQRMSQLSELLTSTTARRIEAENLFNEAKLSLTGASSAGFDDNSAQTMRSDLAKLEAEYQQLSAKFTTEYPRMKELRSQIAGLKSSIHTQRTQIVEGLRAKSIALGQEEKRLREELEQQKSLTFDLAKRQVHYNILKRELESSRELLQNVLRQIKESSLAVEGKSSNVSVVDYAVVPSGASFPNKSLVLLVGIFSGVGLGFVLAFTLSYLDNSVRTPEDLTQLVNIPNLGVVPSFEMTQALPGLSVEDSNDPSSSSRDLVAAENPNNPFPIAFLKDPKSLSAEAYRTIRTGILLSQAGEPPRTILVSSAQSSEGKTTSVMNLAVSLASAGGRVAVIDADLRRPSLGRYFDLEPGLPGVVEVITGQANIQSVGLTHLVRRITFFPSGKIPPNPAELLGSAEMAKIIDSLSGEYDYVLIDSPPVLPVTDAVILSRYVDGVVMVVKGAATPKKLILDAKSRLEAVGTRFLGTILNDIDVTSGDYYYYNQYYSSYYREEEDEPRSVAEGGRKA